MGFENKSAATYQARQQHHGQQQHANTDFEYAHPGEGHPEGAITKKQHADEHHAYQPAHTNGMGTDLGKNIDKKDILNLKTEIGSLVKETKLMFSVIDKILPRNENDAISSLLEFEDNYKYKNIEEEIDDFLYESYDKDISEFSVKKSLKDLRRIKHNIIKLRSVGMELF